MNTDMDVTNATTFEQKTPQFIVYKKTPEVLLPIVGGLPDTQFDPRGK
jgi:thioredoxin-related protein